MRQLVNRGCCGLIMGFTRSHCLPPYNPLGSTTQAQGAHAPVAPQTPTGLTHHKNRRDVWTPKIPSHTQTYVWDGDKPQTGPPPSTTPCRTPTPEHLHHEPAPPRAPPHPLTV